MSGLLLSTMADEQAPGEGRPGAHERNVAERPAAPAPCCAASRAASTRTAEQRATEPPREAHQARPPDDSTMVRLPGGTFWMGSDSADGFAEDGEGPMHKVRLKPFAMDACA